MEFIKYEEAVDALRDVGVAASLRDEAHLVLEADPEATPGEGATICFASPEANTLEGARTVAVEKEQLPQIVDEVIDALHLSQVLMFPVGQWQSVFDAVAFSLASNEDWQEVDAMATVRLHTRDPLLCEPGDYQTIRTLLQALFNDAETPDQGITITSTAKPFIAAVQPSGCVNVMVGSQVLADEIVDSLHLSA